MGAPTVFIDGLDAAELGEVTALSFNRTFGGGQGGGLRDAKFTLDLPERFHHPALRLFAPVELRHGVEPLGEARIVSIDRNTWEIVVDGIVRLGEDYECKDADGAPAGLATGLPLAISRGLPWQIDPSLTLPDTAPDSMQTITDALNDYATQQGKAWLLDGHTLRVAADPTSPILMLLATDNPNSSTDGLVTSITAKYAGAVDEAGNPALIAYVTVEAADAPKRVERTIDLTSNGAMTQADAEVQAKAALTSGATSTLTEAVAVADGALSTIDGTDLTDVYCTIREGRMVRQFDWINPDGSPGLYRDWIIGNVDWDNADGLVLTPVGADASTVVGAIIDLRQGVDNAQGTAASALVVGTPDYLQALINADSATSIGAIPTSAKVGDLAVIGTDAYVCTTGYTSGGTLAGNWTKATDPRTIALIVTTATAFGAAGTAQRSADGKNTITYASIEGVPGISTPGVVGDTTFIISDGLVIAQYKLASISGTNYTWEPVQLDSAVIASLDVGKITGAIAAFLQANITSLTSVTIDTATLHGSTVDTAPSGRRAVLGRVDYGGNSDIGALSFYDGLRAYPGSVTPYAGDTSTSGGIAIYPPRAAQLPNATMYVEANAVGMAAGSMSILMRSGSIFVSGLISAYDSIHTDGYMQTAYGVDFPVTAAPNVWMNAAGTIVQTSGSTRDIKYDIEPAEIDGDLDALERCGVFAYHYYSDPAARCMVGVIVEDMLAAGLRRYVDFDENDQPMQPSWHQITALLIAAHQRNTRRLNTLEARLNALENS